MEHAAKLLCQDTIRAKSVLLLFVCFGTFADALSVGMIIGEVDVAFGILLIPRCRVAHLFSATAC